MKILSASLLAATLLTGSLTFAQTKVPVKTGEKIHSTINTVNKITQTMMGQDMEIDMNVTMTVQTEVKEINPNIHLSSVVTKLLFKNQAMGQSMDFDSDKKEDMDGQIGQSVKGLIGASNDIYISADGKAVEKKKDGETSAAAQALLGGEINDIAPELLLAIPASLKTGDSWTEENNKDADNKKKIVYTIQSLTGNEAVVAFTGEESMKKPKSVQGMTAMITGTNNYKGTLTVDTSSGVVKEKKTSIEGKGETAVMGQSIPFSISSTVSTNARQ